MGGHTVDVHCAVMGASIDVALGSAVHGGEVGSDEGGQHMVPSVCHQAVILGVLHKVLPGWVVLPPVVPAYPKICFATASEDMRLDTVVPAGQTCSQCPIGAVYPRYTMSLLLVQGIKVGSHANGMSRQAQRPTAISLTDVIPDKVVWA